MSAPKKRKTGAKQNIHVHGGKIHKELVENKENEVVAVFSIFFHEMGKPAETFLEKSEIRLASKKSDLEI